jgi:hypothetical protein
MSCKYQDNFSEWCQFWSNGKPSATGDLSDALDEMAVIGARDKKDSLSKDSSFAVSQTKEVYTSLNGNDDQALADAYDWGYDNEPDFVSANPDPNKLPPRPPR